MLGIVTPDLLRHFPPGVTGMEAVGMWRPRQPVTPGMMGRAGGALRRLDALGLSERPLEEMSSGERRRIQLARALAHEPGALLFDEPSTHLDLFAQAELRLELRRLARSGIGLILVTHHLADIIPEIDRVILLAEGRIVGDGPKATLIEPERLAALFGVPVEITERGGFYHAC